MTILSSKIIMDIADPLIILRLALQNTGNNFFPISGWEWRKIIVAYTSF